MRPTDAARPARVRPERVGGRPISGLSRTVLASVAKHLADLLAAGLPLDRSLRVLADSAARVPARALADYLHEEVRRGRSLSGAMAALGGAVPRFAPAMLRTGEAGGNLEGALRALAAVLEQSEELKRRIQAALLYPAVVLIAALLAVMVTVTLVLPRLVAVLATWDVALPWPTRVLMALGGWLDRYGPGLLVLAGLAGLGWGAYIHSPEGRLWRDGLWLRLPGVGHLVELAASARFFQTAGEAVVRGVALVQALELSQEAAANAELTRRLQRVVDRIRQGWSFARACRREKLWGQEAVELIAVGEEAGNLGAVMRDYGRTLQWRFEEQVRTLTALLEPLLVLMVAGVIGFIVVAVLLPVVGLAELPL